MESTSGVIVTTSWDDGHPVDAKLANLMSDIGIKGTFYVPLLNRERPVMTKRSLRDIGGCFEIGAHTKNHVRLPPLRDRALKDEVEGGKAQLEDIIGKKVSMFCYPWGEYDTRARQAVIDAGFIGARTTKEFYTGIADDLWLMPTTILAFPLRPSVRVRHELRTRNWHGLRKLLRLGLGKSWVELASELFRAVLENGGVWHLWGHSWEIEEHGLWDDLKVVFENVMRCEGVTSLTNSEVIQTRNHP